ncbi:MAG: hypothetical protein QM680_11925 [Luteolibacter sp.]
MKITSRFAVAALFAGLTTLACAHEEGGQGGQRQGGQGGFSGPGSLARNPITKALDKDNDGELSAEEIKDASATLLALDKNGDGKLAGEEIRPVRQPRGETPQQIAHKLVEELDKNDDHKISDDELPARMKPMLQRLDADKDGFLSEEEIAKGQEQEKPAEPAGGPRPEGGEKPGA